MSATITIRVPRRLKEKLKQNPAEWSKEVRDFLEERVRQLEMRKILHDVESRAEKRVASVNSVVLIREDRERRS